MQALVNYLTQYPLVAALLAALLLMFVISLVKKAAKLALMTGLVLGISLFITQSQATNELVSQAQSAAHVVVAKGKQAMDAVEKLIADGGIPLVKDLLDP